MTINHASLLRDELTRLTISSPFSSGQVRMAYYAVTSRSRPRLDDRAALAILEAAIDVAAASGRDLQLVALEELGRRA